ncbi:sigma-54 dependent DNA-binding response regulator [Corallococcus coralloides]|uniref:Sigma-54 dependent DNA-binding response regulator n=1 Tax=Corallococcus coralloides TaxID=184914 RepID=A0A410RP60_CORCK|nr:sigma 54-interacting transcriptional regulator [Corallococcus coralloides]QAT83613.1 sigma-54 dependent DNA-binding response regulator [Corallococcus coralloides]
MEHDPSTLQPSGAPGRPASADDAPVPGLLRLTCAGTPMAVAVPLPGALTLGRASPALGPLQDPRMSRSHARVSFDGSRFWVTDLGSQNGTSVDGEPLPANAPREAQRLIRLGDSLFVPSADVGPLVRHGVHEVEGFVRGPAFQQLLEEVARSAQHGFTLHIHGESGTGKEQVARTFHSRGPRSRGPFVAVNCAAIPAALAERLLFGARRGAFSGADDADGYLQAADGGTLFLDEVAELDVGVQAKLLRALETREVLPLGGSKPRKVDVQVCSAGNRDLRAQVAQGRLREDLYFRIGRPEVSLPPLRRRPEELPFLVAKAVEALAPGLPPHVSLFEACLLRPWPGNIRELRVEARAAAQQALLRGAARVESAHLSPGAGTAFGAAPAPLEPPPAGPPAARLRPLDEDARARVEQALRQHGGNVAATARALGMHRTQLRRLLERYGLSPDGA